jgi:opacity protein-like surface antigen
LREKIDLDVNIAGVGSAGRTLGTSEDWIEPFIGGRVIWDLNEKWALHIMGDAGGFGIGSGSDLTWQIAGGVDYKISNNMIFNAGYRYIELDYSRGSGLDELGVDLRAKGPYLGLTILF